MVMQTKPAPIVRDTIICLVGGVTCEGTILYGDNTTALIFLNSMSAKGLIELRGGIVECCFIRLDRFMV
jgi:hypothetical protein